jgi:hypothetical protein
MAVGTWSQALGRLPWLAARFLRARRLRPFLDTELLLRRHLTSCRSDGWRRGHVHCPMR